MELIAGIQEFQMSDFYLEACSLEIEALALVRLIHVTEVPDKNALDRSKEFIVRVECWKAGCLEQRIGNASRNSKEAVWSALSGALMASNDLERLHSIMLLKGFGSTENREYNQRPAKTATAVLRFLFPESWGVVDWRVAAMIGFLNKNGFNIDKAVADAKTNQPKVLRDTYEMISDLDAIHYTHEYRKLAIPKNGLPRAADVDMALFGLSLMAFPFKKKKETLPSS